MIKYVTITVMAFLMLGCATKTEVAPASQTPQKVIKSADKVVKSANKAPSLPAGFVEEKKIKALDPTIPKTCQEWSDGCNTCSRAGNKQANCTVYTCEKKVPFSCLKWQ